MSAGILAVSGICSTFAGVMEDEVYKFLQECCEARKSHAVEYKTFIGTAATLFRMSQDEVEEIVVSWLRFKRIDTLLFGGRCYVYTNTNLNTN